MLNNPNIDDIFRQLGLSPSGGFLGGGAAKQSGFLGSSASGQQGGFLGSGGSNITTAPPNLQPFMPDTPNIMKSKDDNFWTQFGKGLLSPVTDTLAGFGVIDPRDMPTSTAGILGNMVGSMTGWVGFGVFTGGLGIKLGIGAKAAAGAGKAISAATGGRIAATTAATIGKGAALGGFSQAHTWAFGQQEYEAIPKELLVGAITGGLLGGAGSQVAKYLDKSGMLGVSARKAITDLSKNKPELMVHLEDPVSFNAALGKLKGYEGIRARHIVQGSYLDDATKGAVKNFTSAVKSKFSEFNLDPKLTKTWGQTLDMFDNATTKYDLDKTINRMLGQARRLDLEARRLGVESNAGSFVNDAIQDVRKASNLMTTRIFQADEAIHLPHLRQLQDPKLAKGQLLKIHNIAEDSSGVNKLLVYPNKAEEFFRRVMDDTGLNLRPDAKNFRSSDFLDGVAAKFKPEWDEIAKTIKPGDITFIPTATTAFGLNNPIKSGDIQKYLQELKRLPKEVTTGVSYHDSAILQSPVGALAVRLAPVRAIMGEGMFRQFRGASQDHHVYTDSWLKRVKSIAHEQGWDSFRLRNQHGPAVGAIIERKLASEARLNGAYKVNAPKVISHLNQLGVDDTPILRELTRPVAKGGVGLTNKEAGKVISEVRKFMSTGDNRQMFEKAAKRLGNHPNTGQKWTADDLFSEVAADYIHNMKLGQVLKHKNNALRLQGLAKDFGSSKEDLIAAAQGRQLFDELFVASGLDPVKYRAAYLPHFRAYDGQGYKTVLKEFKDIGVDQKTINSIFWANELTRGGNVNYDPNFFTAIERYVIGMSKQKHFEPVFNNINKAYKGINIHSSRAQVYENLKRQIQGIPSEMEGSFNTSFNKFAAFLGQDADPQKAKMIGAALAELQYSAGMGFNPFMPIRNLTQKALALTSITDSGNPLEGLAAMAKFKMAKASGTKEAAQAIRLNDILTHRVYTEGLDLQPQGLIKLAQMMGFKDAHASTMDKVMRDKAMAMFKWSDRSNVEDVFGARFMYLQNKGFSLADSVEMARATTMATQFMYGIDSPMLWKTPIGKQIGIFQSWPLNWAQMLWEQGTQGAMQRAAGTIVVMAGASELLSMTGISFRSIHPTETVRGVLPYKMLEGEQSWPLAFRVTASSLDYMRAIADGDPHAVDTAINNLTRSAEALVPFGVVTNRTLKFMDRVRHDWKDYADTGFLHTASIKPQTRENTSRLVRILGDVDQETGVRDMDSAKREAYMAWFGTTTRSIQRMEDSQFVSKIQGSYQRTRRMAIQSFIDQDFDQFQRLQEQLVLNFGRWIEPKDIQQELQYMQMTARERQTRSLPSFVEDSFYESILDPRTPKSWFY